MFNKQSKKLINKIKMINFINVQFINTIYIHTYS